MRLTSYNMAVKILSARCCLASMVERMWAYMEDGDVENADCVREKALMLSGLIKAAKRWKPTVVEGYENVIDFNLSSTTHPSPFIVDSISINGLKIVPRFIAYGGTQDVVAKQIRSGNCYISPNDDLISVRYSKVNNERFVMSIVSKDPLETLDAVNSGGASGVPVVNFIKNNVSFSGGTPKCLTDAQILSIVGKIDELCGCKC
jgi:hypothetical protein